MEEKNFLLAATPGTVVAGKYRIDRILAEGGMGLVVSATHLQLGQRVAVKLLRSDRGDVDAQWDALARFPLEAKAVAQLQSEHVAHVLDSGMTDDGTPYMVMEYLEGQSLARTLQDKGPLSVATAAEYIIHACEGLAEAHAHGIVHRDIKPYNLFLVERSPGWPVIKIVDFGISKFAFPETSNVVTGVIIGTPCYMSPEQLRSTAAVDHRSDIWSLGATLHELLAGRPAFDPSQTLPELVASILEHPAPALRDLRAGIPVDIAAIVNRCLTKDREARFQSAGELAMALLPFAPPRARVPAERALAFKETIARGAAPARDLRSETPTRLYEVRAPSESVSSTPSDFQPATNGTSLAPVAMHAPAFPDTMTPPPLSAAVEATQAQEEGFDMEDNPFRRRAPKWLGPAALGTSAALLFLAILFAVPGEQGSKAPSAAKATPPLVAAPMVAQPEALQFPTASLAPLSALDTSSPPAPASQDAPSAPRSARASTQSKTDGSSSAVVSARGRTSPASARSAKAVPVSSPVAPPPAPPPFVAQPSPQTQLASTGGEVDSAGGKIPLHPIEKRDPYGRPAIETRDPYGSP